MTMVDDDVEIVLREIRESVVAQSRAEQIAATSVAGNGDGAIVQPIDEEVSTAAELARISGYLTTTARAWDRLPPVISNRGGSISRFELWLKSRAKSFARWFTWEQINFNAAVHHALRDTLDALSQQQAAIDSLRAQLHQQAASRKDEFAETCARLVDLSTRIDALVAELRNESEARRRDSQTQRSDINTIRAELRGESEALRIQMEDSEKRLQSLVERTDQEQTAQLTKLTSEFRERDDQLESEHRASFKQLALEASEAAAFQATTRRKLESALAELDQPIQELAATVKRRNG